MIIVEFLELNNGEICQYDIVFGYYRIQSKTYKNVLIIPVNGQLNKSGNISQFDIKELYTRETHPAYYL